MTPRPPPNSGQPVEGPPLRPSRVRIAIACLVALPVAVWWVLGDLSEQDGYLRIAEPPPVPSALENVIGLAALCAALVTLAVLMSSKDDRDRERRWRPVFGAFLTLGVVIGFGSRILTAQTVGANIGGGLFLLAAPWAALGLTLWGALRAYKLARLTVPDGRRPSI